MCLCDPTILFSVPPPSAGLIPAGHTGGMSAWTRHRVLRKTSGTPHTHARLSVVRAAWFTDLAPAPRQTNLSIHPRCRAGSPALPSLSSSPGPQRNLPSTRMSCSFQRHMSPASPATTGETSCALSKPGTWPCMLVYGPLISSGFLMPLVTCWLSHILLLLLCFKSAFVLP